MARICKEAEEDPAAVVDDKSIALDFCAQTFRKYYLGNRSYVAPQYKAGKIEKYRRRRYA